MSSAERVVIPVDKTKAAEFSRHFGALSALGIVQQVRIAAQVPVKTRRDRVLEEARRFSVGCNVRMGSCLDWVQANPALSPAKEGFAALGTRRTPTPDLVLRNLEQHLGRPATAHDVLRVGAQALTREAMSLKKEKAPLGQVLAKLRAGNLLRKLSMNESAFNAAAQRLAKLRAGNLLRHLSMNESGFNDIFFVKKLKLD